VRVTLIRHAEAGDDAPRDESRALTILVHGLDCNRFNWAPMADYLERNGHQVAYFTYPSDQPLVDSAALFREQMTLLHDAYPNLLINVLTHSMGALVARQYIEGPDYQPGTVERLIISRFGGGPLSRM